MLTTDRGQVLLPAKKRFVYGSLLLALVAQAFLVQLFGPQGTWLPDLLLLTLMVWALYQPYRIGIVFAFILGLSMDVLHEGLLGQHALSYISATALVLLMQRRLRQFPAREQAPQMLPLLALAQLLLVLTGLISSWTWPGWWVLLKPMLETLVWPPLAWILLAPQRLPPDGDVHRPISA